MHLTISQHPYFWSGRPTFGVGKGIFEGLLEGVMGVFGGGTCANIARTTTYQKCKPKEHEAEIKGYLNTYRIEG